MLFETFVSQFQVFMAVFSRVLGILLMAPVFTGSVFPVRFRAGLAFFVSIISTPMVIGGQLLRIPVNLPDYGVLLLSNLFLGVALGVLMNIVFSAFQMSGQFFSIPMGLGLSEVVDPMSEVQVPALGNLIGILAILLLIRMDGHVAFISTIVDSFHYASGIQPDQKTMLLDSIIEAVHYLFVIAIQLSMPVLTVTLLLDFGLGLISKVAPQFNVMVMGFNIKILAGFIILWLAIPAITDLGIAIMEQLIATGNRIIRLL